MDWIGPHQSIFISEMQLLKGNTIVVLSPLKFLLVITLNKISYEKKHDSHVQSLKNWYTLK